MHPLNHDYLPMYCVENETRIRHKMVQTITRKGSAFGSAIPYTSQKKLISEPERRK